MPTPFDGPTSELTGLALFLDAQRAALLRKLEGLTDEQAASRPIPSSALSLLALVKHVAFVERRWSVLEIARRDVPGLWPPPDDEEWRLDPSDTVVSVRALYDGVIADARAALGRVPDLDSESPTAPPLNRRWVLLHLIEELARHAGHADLLREAIDGARGV